MRLNSAYEIVKVNDACLLVDIESDIYYKIDEELFCMRNFMLEEVETVEMLSHFGSAIAGVIVGGGIGIAGVIVGAAVVT